jgi:hypothetical protein
MTEELKGIDRTGKRRNAEQLWKKKKSSSSSSNAVQAHHCLISNLITTTNFGGLKSKSILQRDDLETINLLYKVIPLFFSFFLFFFFFLKNRIINYFLIKGFHID